MTEGTVIKIVSQQYTVLIGGESHIATPMGKLRLGLTPRVGDHVLVEFLDEKWVIQKVLERKNELLRPNVVNVDQVLIVMSVVEPDFSYTLVDRLIFLVALSAIEPILIVSKADLGTSQQLAAIEKEYVPYGYTMIVTGEGIDSTPFNALFNDKISVLAGQSGVGKSSLLNRLNPDFKLTTQEISKVLGRGKHTTRHNQLFAIAGGWVADTPGFSSLDFSHVNAQDLAQAVPDFKPYLGQCRYRNCLHEHEPSCKIKEKVADGTLSEPRYQHYRECLTIIKEEN